jgi:hypothetical protein
MKRYAITRGTAGAIVIERRDMLRTGHEVRTSITVGKPCRDALPDWRRWAANLLRAQVLREYGAVATTVHRGRWRGCEIIVDAAGRRV